MSSNKPTLKLDWCSAEAAKHAVEHWHYSGSLPASKKVKVGVWENEVFIGCVIFAWGANNHLAGQYGLKQTECCELCRVALNTHQTPVSRIVAIATKMFRKLCPGVRLIVSFADTKHDHHGGIYQAGNWLYVGQSATTPDHFLNGRWMHQRSVNAMFGTIRGDQMRRPGFAKHKYLMPLDDEMRAQLLPLVKPYPKRATSIGSDVPGHQPGEGGANPTVALDSKQQ